MSTAAARSRHLLVPKPRTALEQSGWTVRRSGGIAFLSVDAMASIPWLVHGFSLRPGGESLLNSEHVLNLGVTDWDGREVVHRNRAKFFSALGADEMTLVALRQIHSDVIYSFAERPTEPRRGDGAITQTAGLVLGVQTADCVPVLLVDVKRRAVAAIHAGWRGTLARVAAKTVGRMRLEFGTQPKHLRAALGPAIGRCSYEVGPEVAQAFAGQFSCASEWFDGPFDQLAFGEEPNPLPWLTMMPPGHERPPERVWLDLRAANRWQLLDVGVPAQHIHVSAHCTSCRTDWLFSYRREGPSTGRMMGAIGIRTRKVTPIRGR